MFNGSTGAYITSATTNSPNGDYTFNGLAAGNYIVRVVSSSVTSSRGGAATPVMTFRTNAGSGISDVTDYVGGHDLATADAGNAASGWILNSSTGVFSGSGSGKAHAFAPVTISTANVSGVDFGFNFDTIVEHQQQQAREASGSSSTNANTLNGDTSLAQSGLMAGKENAVFMISQRGRRRQGCGHRSTTSAAAWRPSPWPPCCRRSRPSLCSMRKNSRGGPACRLSSFRVAGHIGNGLTISGGNSIVRGFAWSTGSRGAESHLQTAGGNVVQGNHLGTNAAGTAKVGNSSGIMIMSGSGSNIVGGTGVARGTVVSGNAGTGIRIEGSKRWQHRPGELHRHRCIGNAGPRQPETGVGIHSGSKSNVIGRLRCRRRERHLGQLAVRGMDKRQRHGRPHPTWETGSGRIFPAALNLEARASASISAGVPTP
ncbi:MAG: hypothetical protein MZV70_66015 [Desulfobacterales bacterium]|nr:hypothetical protein [Desulfobacterales bacterium]